jgi:hypothetical protein
MFLTTKVARKDRQIARMRREIRELRALSGIGALG